MGSAVLVYVRLVQLVVQTVAKRYRVDASVERYRHERSKATASWFQENA